MTTNKELLTEYTVRIESIAPSITQKELFLHRRCYLGISIGNPQFRSESFQVLLEWISSHFDECLIVVGDYLQRYNEHIFYNRQAKEAEIESLRMGDAFLKESEKYLSRLTKEQFRVTRWKPYLDSPEYHKAKKILDELFVSSFEFRESIDKTSTEFISRQMKNKKGPVVDKKTAIALSTQYLLEEIAVFSVLVENGWAVEVYPGSEIPVLVDIAAGKFPHIPPALKQRINVELRINKKSKNPS
ncbi:tRNA-dependent cyclodipeptide synthase [bacterium]|nr:tRNA-dependent cyclodipeptide synthase [bacterium]